MSPWRELQTEINCTREECIEENYLHLLNCDSVCRKTREIMQVMGKPQALNKADTPLQLGVLLATWRKTLLMKVTLKVALRTLSGISFCKGMSWSPWLMKICYRNTMVSY